MNRIDSTKPVTPITQNLNGATSQSGQLKHEADAKIAADTYRVEISPESKDALQLRSKVLEAAKQTVPERDQKIAELKSRIKSGQYEVNSDKIADGMMRESIRDHIAMQMHEEAKQR